MHCRVLAHFGTNMGGGRGLSANLDKFRTCQKLWLSDSEPQVPNRASGTADGLTANAPQGTFSVAIVSDQVNNSKSSLPAFFLSAKCTSYSSKTSATPYSMAQTLPALSLGNKPALALSNESLLTSVNHQARQPEPTTFFTSTASAH